MKLSNYSIEELEYRLCVCNEEPDLADVVPELEKVLAAGTVEALSQSRATQNELEIQLAVRDGKELTAMVRDLCLAGYFPVHTGKPALGRMTKTRTVNGIKYSCGY